MSDALKSSLYFPKTVKAKFYICLSDDIVARVFSCLFSLGFRLLLFNSLKQFAHRTLLISSFGPRLLINKFTMLQSSSTCLSHSPHPTLNRSDHFLNYLFALYLIAKIFFLIKIFVWLVMGIG